MEIIKYRRSNRIEDRIFQEECDRSVFRSWVWVIFFGVLLLIPLILGILVVYTPSSIISISYDFRTTNFAPSQPLQLVYQEEKDDIIKPLFASEDNATFSPLTINVLLLYPPTMTILATEMGVSQVGRSVENGTNEEAGYSWLTKTDYYLASAPNFIDISKIQTLEYRVSADYGVLVKITVLITFDNSSFDSHIINFVYSKNHGIGENGTLTGITAFELNRWETFELSITGIQYDFNSFPSYNYAWQNESEIPPYPFLLLGSERRGFNLGNYIRVK